MKASSEWDHLLTRARMVCEREGTTLTRLRELVLAELWAAPHPLGAYGLADLLSVRTGHRVAPNSVYRILELLKSLDLVYRVESKHAYAITAADCDHADLLLLCDDCGGVTAVSDDGVRALVKARSESRGFHPSRQLIEVAGQCPACHEDDHLHD